MILIESIDAREILDSRGNPTVEAVVETSKGAGKAKVPSGASTGSNEALELRDGGSRYGGKGVQEAVKNIRVTIGPELIGEEVTNQSYIDDKMIALDGEEDKSNLGANAILAVSLAAARAAADSLNIPLFRYLGRSNDLTLPVPYLNVLNGGEHAGNDLDIQEYMIVPDGAESFKEGIRMGTEVYHALGDIIEEKYGPSATNLGDEGGYAPPLENPTEPFDLMMEAIDRCDYDGKINLAIDTAATEFKTSRGYVSGDETLGSEEMINFYDEMIKDYPLVSIEDPLGESDWGGFAEMTDRFNDELQIVGDDLFVSDPELIEKGIEMGACNAVLLKVNQIGTLTEAMDAASLAFKNGYDVMVSHRSGETPDPFIADLAVALSCGEIKSGAPARGERVAKYNRLLDIEQKLGNTADYAL